jgi:AbrB family looped-hinge helix DNA binding protein
MPETKQNHLQTEPTLSPEPTICWDDHFFGAVTVGERGQVVIPAAARKRFHIEPGDKLLMMGDPHKRSLMLFKLDTLREFMTMFQESIAQMELGVSAVSEDAIDEPLMAQQDSENTPSQSTQEEK